MSYIGNLPTPAVRISEAPTFTAGVSTSLTLVNNPGDTNSVDLYFDGVYQQKNTYVVTGKTITLDAAVPAGTLRVEVVFNQAVMMMPQTGGGVGPNGTTIAYQNAQVINDDYTFAAGSNYVSAGPLTIADGKTVLISDGVTWGIV